MQRLFQLFAIACVSYAATANAADWGDLKVKFTYDGPLPKAIPVDVTKDPAFCGKHGLVDERLVVNPKNKGVRDVIVYMYRGRSRKKVPVHPDYKAPEKVTIDNKNCRYEPHVVCVPVGSKLEIGNPDPVAHNSKIDFFKNPSRNPIIPATKSVDFKLEKAESLPAKVSCSIHPWMSAWVVVQDHPYMSSSDENGDLTIKNIPAGEWTFQFWHDKAGYLGYKQEVVVDGKKTKWNRGRPELKITKSGLTMEVKIPAKAFASD